MSYFIIHSVTAREFKLPRLKGTLIRYIRDFFSKACAQDVDQIDGFSHFRHRHIMFLCIQLTLFVPIVILRDCLSFAKSCGASRVINTLACFLLKRKPFLGNAGRHLALYRLNAILFIYLFIYLQLHDNHGINDMKTA